DTKVQCQRTGKQGNGYVKGQIDSIIDPFTYFLSCENLTESDGGADAATDEEFYELLRLSMDGYSCAGARGGYIYFAKQVSTEIADVIAASPTPGVVNLYVLMDDGTPATEEMKERVLTACSADDVRPLTDFVSVEDPEKVTYNVDLTYYIQSGGPVSAEALELAVAEKVKEFIKWQSAKLGRDINPSRLISMLMETGIKRVAVREPAFTKLRDGSDTADISAEQFAAPQVAALGTVIVQSGGYEDE
ncbi:MAG: baseplate J/gp47 family protein, partial [Dysosmobacter sp.]|nr:baseplate J/gp47 family protein [Dysosmobacter sp.]